MIIITTPCQCILCWTWNKHIITTGLTSVFVNSCMGIMCKLSIWHQLNILFLLMRSCYPQSEYQLAWGLLVIKVMVSWIVHASDKCKWVQTHNLLRKLYLKFCIFWQSLPAHCVGTWLRFQSADNKKALICWLWLCTGSIVKLTVKVREPLHFSLQTT